VIPQVGFDGFDRHGQPERIELEVLVADLLLKLPVKEGNASVWVYG
jgi:hypothetical protein